MKKALQFAGVTMCALAMAVPAWARQLSPEEALERVAADNGTSAVIKKKAAASAGLSLVYRADAPAKTDLPMVYVFSGKNSFVVTSADDEFPAVLGYGDNGDFDADNMPPQLKWWLGEYAREMEYYLDHKPETTASDTRAIARIAPELPAISPMVKTLWDQDAPYNRLSPTLELTNSTTTYETVTGCVATAMAQVMKYHNWPDVGVGSHSYTWQPYSNAVAKTLSCDFSAMKFDWDNMLDVYGSSYTDAQGDAVAQLMYACGVSLDMEYNASQNGGSGAVTAEIASALVNYFKYSRSAFYATRDLYSYDEWENLIYNELKEKRPVVLNGRGTGGGHAFVCDGYAGDHYFHINWGWSGSSNGNFLLCRLSPDDLGIGGGAGGFNSGQGAICGIRPVRDGNDTGELEDAFIGFTGDLSYSGTSYAVSGNGLFYNMNRTATFSGSYGSIFENFATGENVLEVKTMTVSALSPSYGYRTYRIASSTLPPDGTYKVYPAYWLSTDTKARKMRHGGGKVYYLVIRIANGQMSSISVPDISDEDPDLIALFCTAGKVKLGSAATFSSAIANTSENTDYYGNLTIHFAPKGSSSEIASDEFSFDLPAGLTLPYSYARTFTGVSTGEYEAWFTDRNGRVISNRYPFTIEEATSTSTATYELVSVSPVQFLPNVKTTVQPILRNNSSSDAYWSNFIYTYTDQADPTNVVQTEVGYYRPLDAGYNYRLNTYDITFTKPGVYTFTVTREKFNYSGTLTKVGQDVLPGEVEVIVGSTVKSVTLSETAVNLKVNDTKSLVATVLPEDAAHRELFWTSSAPDVVTVDDKGNLKAVAEGTAKVYAATANGTHSVCAVTVSKRTGVEDILADDSDAVTAVYDIRGVRVLTQPQADDIKALPRGAYIVTTVSGAAHKVVL